MFLHQASDSYSIASINYLFWLIFKSLKNIITKFHFHIKFSLLTPSQPALPMFNAWYISPVCGDASLQRAENAVMWLPFIFLALIKSHKKYQLLKPKYFYGNPILYEFFSLISRVATGVIILIFCVQLLSNKNLPDIFLVK